MRVTGGAYAMRVLAIAMFAAACGHAETVAQTSPQSRPATTNSTPGQAADAAVGGRITLEFDLPPEFMAQPAGGADTVTGFRVGYFRANESNAIRTVDVARDAVIVRGRAARVTVPRDIVPDCGVECAIRVQTLTRGAESLWSAPVPLDARAVKPQAVPPRPAAPRAAPETSTGSAPVRPARRAGLTAGDLEKYPVLSELLRKLLPADAPLDAELARFRRIQDLAWAVVISRDNDIPFTTLSKAIEGPPRVSPRNALAKLRPDSSVRDGMRKARAEVRELIANR